MRFNLKTFHNTLLCRSALVCFILLFFTLEVFPEASRVVIVKSSNRLEYEQTSAEIIKSLVNNGVTVVAVEELTTSSLSDNKKFWKTITEKNPDLIITVGTSATSSAIANVQSITIIFTMVLDQFDGIITRSYSTGSKDISGVTLAISVQEQLEILREAMPLVRRVGFLYNKNSMQMYLMARSITRDMGLQLVPYEISSEGDISNALKDILPEIDVFWMPPDAIIYNEPNILRFILRECYINSVPVMAVSKHLASAGAPIALGIDYTDIGKQTAELVVRKLRNGNASHPVIESPRKLILYINNRVLSSLGITIPDRVLGKAVPVESER